MDGEKRKGDQPVPEDIKRYLNDAQLVGLHHIEAFGWQLKFIRRPLFQDPFAVVVNPDGTSIGILEVDGKINLEPDIEVRD